MEEITNKTDDSAKKKQVDKKEMIPRPNRRTGEWRACPVCGKNYYIPKCRLTENKYCSTKCNFQMNSRWKDHVPKMIECPGCHQIKIHHSKGYCHNCYNKFIWGKNPKKKLLDKDYYQKNRNKIISRVGAWKQENKEKVNKNQRKNYYKDIAKSRKHGRENSRMFRKTIRGKILTTKRNFFNRDHLHDISIKILHDVLNYNLRKFGAHFCEKCGKFLGNGKEFYGSIDHIVPLSRDGDNIVQNLQILCRSCNSKKFINIYDYRQNNAWLN